MSLTHFYRLSAATMMLGGVFVLIKKLIVEIFLPVSPVTNAAGTIGLLLSFFSLTGLYLYQSKSLGRLGLIGFLVNWFGIGAVAGLDYARLYVLPFLDKEVTTQLLAGPTMTVFFVTALIFLAGVLLFGVSMLRARVLPYLPVVMYIIGYIPYSLPTLFPVPIVRIAQVVATLGIMGMGYALWMLTRKAEPVELNRTVPA